MTSLALCSFLSRYNLLLVENPGFCLPFHLFYICKYWLDWWPYVRINNISKIVVWHCLRNVFKCRKFHLFLVVFKVNSASGVRFVISSIRTRIKILLSGNQASRTLALNYKDSYYTHCLHSLEHWGELRFSWKAWDLRAGPDALSVFSKMFLLSLTKKTLT